MDQKKEEKQEKQKKLPDGKAKLMFSLTQVMEDPAFQKILETSIKTYIELGDNYAKYKAYLEQDFKEKMNQLSLAHSNGMRNLLKKYPDPGDLAVMYLDLHNGKKAKEHLKPLIHNEKEALEYLFQGVVRATAIEMLKRQEPKKEEKEQ